jgi:hypothetical protein
MESPKKNFLNTLSPPLSAQALTLFLSWALRTKACGLLATLSLGELQVIYR